MLPLCTSKAKRTKRHVLVCIQTLMLMQLFSIAKRKYKYFVVLKYFVTIRNVRYITGTGIGITSSHPMKQPPFMIEEYLQLDHFFCKKG